MRIIIDEIDGTFYADIILYNDDLEHLQDGKVVQDKVTIRRRLCYVGVQLEDGSWMEEDEAE